MSLEFVIVAGDRLLCSTGSAQTFTPLLSVAKLLMIPMIGR